MSKAAVYEAMITIPGFTPGNVFRSASSESPESRPFMVIVWGDETPAFRAVGSEVVTIWVFDEPGDYGRIEETLQLVRDWFMAATEVPGADGFVLSQAVFNGGSGDLYDDVYKCIMRNMVFTTVTHRSTVQSL